MLTVSVRPEDIHFTLHCSGKIPSQLCTWNIEEEHGLQGTWITSICSLHHSVTCDLYPSSTRHIMSGLSVCFPPENHCSFSVLLICPCVIWLVSEARQAFMWLLGIKLRFTISWSVSLSTAVILLWLSCITFLLLVFCGRPKECQFSEPTGFVFIWHM